VSIGVIENFLVNSMHEEEYKEEESTELPQAEEPFPDKEEWFV
jgi:hypothetical protein